MTDRMDQDAREAWYRLFRSKPVEILEEVDAMLKDVITEKRK